MIAIVARKEMTEMMRDGRFRWSALIVLALLLASLLLGWQHYRDVAAQHETARRTTREHWLNQGSKNPHSAAHYGVYAFKPKTPLSFVDPGVDPWVGVAAWLEAHKQNEFRYRPAQDSTAVQRFGELTGATVLQVLIPLLIVMLAFPAFASEREQGTLRQLLSLGAKRTHLAAGKALGIASALGVLLIPATAAGVLALSLASENGMMIASVPRMALMGASYLLYFAALLAVSLTVSAWARSSRLALVALLGFWIVNSLIAPRAAADIAKAAFPTPSAFEFSQRMDLALRDNTDEVSARNTRAERLKQELFRKHNVSRIEDLPVDFGGLALQAGEEHGNEVFDRFHAELWDTFKKQEWVHHAASPLAPLLAVRSLSMALAGTDFAQHAHFARAAEEYRRGIQREMNLNIAYNAKSVNGPYLRGRDLWEKVPDFAYESPGAAWVLDRQKLPLLLLLAWTGATIALAWMAVVRLRLE
jgi:ABC-2 type transport system permease protein